MSPHFANESVTLHHGDCLDVMRSMPADSVDSIVTDPPYGLGFMGRAWDALPPGEEWARECLRVLKPGGHLLAFGGTRTWHRLTVAVEDAGFEIRDSIAWHYGSGFPKSLNVSKALAGKGVCRCDVGEWTHGDRDVQRVREGVSDATRMAEAGQVTDVLASVQREGAGAGLGQARTQGLSGLEDATEAANGSGQPGMEGRGDTQASEGQLHGGALRQVPARVSGDGAGGRLHHGAPASNGPVDRALSAAVGSGEPQGSRPVEQSAGEPGTVSVERRPQAWGGWPVCERCSQPVIPDGLGTALKPAFEPIVVARKPITGTVAGNVLAHGTGALNVDGCRVQTTEEPGTTRGERRDDEADWRFRGGSSGSGPASPAGRWPANVILDEDMAAALDEQSGIQRDGVAVRRNGVKGGTIGHPGAKAVGSEDLGYGGSGGASRFFYVAKAPKSERPVVDGVAHATVKPLTLMRWLVRLVTPPGGTVLEPFAGSGTTIEAAILEGFNVIGIEREAEYLPLIQVRIDRAAARDTDLFGGAA